MIEREAASRLVAELMLVSALVAESGGESSAKAGGANLDEGGAAHVTGKGRELSGASGAKDGAASSAENPATSAAADFARALREAGAAADTTETRAPGAYDLLVLLATGPAEHEASAQSWDNLAEASDRVLFVPAPAAQDHLAGWFEFFIERDFQPVVEFDARFVGPGAFLVDRTATAGEEELSAFADRLQTPPPPAARAEQPPEPVQSAQDQELYTAMQAALAQIEDQKALIAALSAPPTCSGMAPVEASYAATGWEGLREWVNATIRDPLRDTEVALARDLPRLNALRGEGMPTLALTGPARPPGRWTRWFRRRQPALTLPLLQHAALIRASRYFDPAWYVAASPELSAGEPVDPAFHYAVVGSLRGEDPGPYFDTAAYFAAHPEARNSGQSALLHAILSGADEAA